MTEKVWQYVVAHSTAIVVAAGFVGTAFASTVPENRPKTLDDLWNWMRDFVHQLSNAKHPTGNDSTTQEAAVQVPK